MNGAFSFSLLSESQAQLDPTTPGKSMNPKRDRLPRLPRLPQLSKQPGEVIAMRKVPHEAFEPLIGMKMVFSYPVTS